MNPSQFSGPAGREGHQAPFSSDPVAGKTETGKSRLPVTGVILAGGQSRRLGRDKASLRLGGRPLALWVAAALAPVVSTCWLSTNQPLAHLAFGLPVITDLQPDQGPLGGLVTALFFARTPWVLAVAVDTPSLVPALLSALVSRAPQEGRAAVVCRTSRGLEPFPGIYAGRLAPQLLEFLESDRGFTRFLERCHPLVLAPEEVSLLDPEGLSFINLNTPEELARAAGRLVGLQGAGEA